MKKSYLFMIIAAVLAAINVPVSKLVMGQVSPILMASIVYLGGGFVSALAFLWERLFAKKKETLLSGTDWLYLGIINTLDVAANIMLFYGLSLLNGETASLLQSFEVVATALLAFLFFRERISWRTFLAIVLILGASVFLSFNPAEGFSFQPASLLILGATICWGVDNNLTKRIAHKDQFEFSTVKCGVPGLLILGIAFLSKQTSFSWPYLAYGFLNGMASYGLSIIFMVMAFKTLSASDGTAIYATNPFIGAVLSLVVFQTTPLWSFYVAVFLLLAGEAFVYWDAKVQEKKASLVSPSAN